MHQFLLSGEVPPVGTMIRQPELAETFNRLAEKGHAGFYQGETAEKLLAGVRAAGGIWTREDLSRYQIVERTPVKGTYKGMKITSAALPSSGGIVLVTMLNILSGFDLGAVPSVTRKRLLVEAMRRAYRDRAEYLGDPDFVDIPTERLISTNYAAGLARDIQLDVATPSRLQYNPSSQGEGRDTTHYSIIDAEGNRVSATMSINYPFGSCFVPPGTGVLLNDEMDDFSARPGVPNVYGLIGGEANAIAPGKRMLSSMTPTFVETEQGVGVIGTPGGSRIITMLLHGILELADSKGVDAWVIKPRFHHQFLPDQIQFEPDALTQEEQETLKSMGHELKPLERGYGNMQAVFWHRGNGELSAASDPRV